MYEEEEERQLRAVALQNAHAIFLKRQRNEGELQRAKNALELRTAELADSLSMMRATLESTADGILVTDGRGRVSGHNEKFNELWRLPQEVIATCDHRKFVEAMSTNLSDPAGFTSDVERILLLAPSDRLDLLELVDGRVFERYTRIQRVGERVVGRVWSYRDVTERVRFEEALREAKMEAEGASRAKTAFLATMSHELRTPLNAIAGYADLLALGIGGPVTDKQQLSIERIQASQRHLLQLIEEVLDQAGLETGMITYRSDDVELREALADAEAEIAAEVRANDLALQIGECPTQLHIRADREKLLRILGNLLSNAVKFTEPGGRVDVQCHRAGKDIQIVVSDTGIGIAEDEFESIFEPFVQVRSDLTRTAEGTGLGLAISRSFARSMGGNLTVTSVVGEGSAFTLTLPALPVMG